MRRSLDSWRIGSRAAFPASWTLSDMSALWCNDLPWLPPRHWSARYLVEEIIIEAGRTEANYWRDLWRYRELFYFLAWRDMLVRYKQTAIGITWALIRPLLTTVV